jgi:hypothetical protein
MSELRFDETKGETAVEIKTEVSSDLPGDWPARCIEEAQKTNPIPASMSAILTDHLQGVAGERALRNSELIAISVELITAMNRSSGEEPAP